MSQNSVAKVFFYNLKQLEKIFIIFGTQYPDNSSFKTTYINSHLTLVNYYRFRFRQKPEPIIIDFDAQYSDYPSV